jgi:hypothetical protein
MVIDVHAWIGHYAFREVAISAEELVRCLDEQAIDEAWISHLGAVYWRDPTAGNDHLFQAAERHSRLRPVPAVHPGLPGWSRILAAAADRGAPAVRADPTCYGLAPAGSEMRALAAAAAGAGLPLVLTVKLEDGRQRHPNDPAPELPPWAVRALVRSDPGVRLVVTAADREFIEQVHHGSTAAEAGRILWDISWIWGPPEDHLTHLVRTLGAERFCFGTGVPLRIAESSIAKLDLAELPAGARAAIEGGNLERQLGAGNRPRA